MKGPTAQEVKALREETGEGMMACKKILEEKGCGVYVEGGSDEDIAEAMSMHTYGWNRDWFVGDTSVVKEFFTARFYRDRYEFNEKFTKLFYRMKD